MISKSTRRKRRLNRATLRARSQVQLVRIDKRTDHWLISHPDPQLGKPWWTFHMEVQGKEVARREHSKLMQGITA